MAADRELTAGVRDAWPIDMPLHELGGQTVERRIVAEGPALGRIARAVGLDALKALEANLQISPWLDGAQIHGRWRAEVVQTCGVTLEPFESRLAGEFTARAAPGDSPALGGAGPHELDLDPDAEDPPDEIEDGRLPLGAYVVEDLSLAIDPFPRKPGVAFEAPPQADEPSPFAALAKFKPRSS